MNATAANDNATTPTTTKKGKVIEVRNIKRRDHKRNGTVYPGHVDVGQHADVTPGKSIRLHGTDSGYRHPVVPHDITFEVGGQAVYDSYNLYYTGTIVSITAKTVTIKSQHGCKHRLSTYDFNHHNAHYDADRIARENATTMQCI